MNKDHQIQQLFDDYANELPVETQLADVARREPVAPKKVAWWKPLIAVCCVLILFVTVGIAAYRNYGKNATDVPQKHYSAYGKSDVQGKVLTQTESETIIPTILPLDKLAAQGYEISRATYYAYYFKNSKELAFIVAVFGVYTDNGIVEVQLIAESNGHVLYDLKEKYNDYISGNGQLVTIETYQGGKGEYTSMAFFEARNMHFYVSTLTNKDNATEVGEILEILT